MRREIQAQTARRASQSQPQRDISLEDARVVDDLLASRGLSLRSFSEAVLHRKFYEQRFNNADKDVRLHLHQMTRAIDGPVLN